MSKKISRLASLILFISVVLVFVFNRHNFSAQTPANPQVSNTPSPTVTVEAKQSSFSFVATSSGQLALDLVQSQVELSLKEYDFGTMVEGVNGLLADTKHYWALYQNGDYAKTGIADLELSKGDTIELKYEEIKF